MKYVDEYRDPAAVQACAREIAAAATRPWTLMEVCGGQTHAIVKHGLDALLPPAVTLIHGPGCPVCVTDAALLDKAHEIAARPQVIFCTFGDMLRRAERYMRVVNRYTEFMLEDGAGQVLMPLICLGTFLIKTRDPFGASVCLWWTAESIMDVAPYINDARDMDLMLLGGVTGKETDGHDWNNILSMLGWLEYDHRLAHLAYNVGILLMLVSFAWGGWILLRHYRRLA